MESKTLTCINCPMGCQVTITYEMKDGRINEETMTVTGNTCLRGKTYAISEVTNPVRTVTGTVGLSNRELRVVPVKTKTPVPKDKVPDVAKALADVKVEAPVHIGDVVIKNVCGTGSDIVITDNIE
ncbi:MAG: DUF1667 domain-containing protein [Lachnospiraceae bacterium]|nr:DUF1667 domain-containing protein [Lachnospiraceae bacterium]